jgi:putative ABC transport system permease protein
VYDESIGSLNLGASGSSVHIKQITDADIVELKKLSFVDQVRPNYQLTPRYITREGQKKYTLSAQVYNPGQKPELAAGRGVPTQGDIANGDALLPDSYLSLLGFKNAADAIGKEIQIVAEQPTLVKDVKTMKLKIVGVTKPPAAALSIAGMSVLLGDKDARDLYDFTTKGTAQYGKYTYAHVRVKGGADVTVAEHAKADLKAKGYYVQTSQDVQKTVTQFVNVLQSLVGVFGVITVVASVFGIINTMYISVLERTREIGLMKALGMRGKDVSWLFRLEAAWIGFLGGAIGAVGAFVLGTAINPWLTKTLNLGDGNSILIFDWFQIAALIIILILVAIIAGWLPARKAAHLDPIEALRTE